MSLNISTSTSKYTLVLDTEKDWIPWFEYISLIADEYGVSNYINPNVPFPGLPTEPIRPTPAKVKPETEVSLPQTTASPPHSLLTSCTF
jgi:hypothetical protein